MKKLFTLFTLTALLAGCGGGGSDTSVAEVEANTSVEANTPITYNSAASEGELLEYTLDIDNLSYTYKITESQLGLSNDLKTGTLTKNADGTYTPSTAPDSKVLLLPNKMVVSATTINVGGVEKVTLIAGVPKATQTVLFSDIDGTYNYAGLQCYDSPSCNTRNAIYGTFNIQSDGSWTECSASNYTSNTTNCSGKSVGILNALENGKFQILESDGKDWGTAMYYTQPSGHQIMIIDLKDTSVTGYGRGMVVGVPQRAIPTDSNNADGTWHYNRSDGDYGSFVISGFEVVSDDSFEVTPNSPWDGFITPDGSSTKILFADEGVMFWISYLAHDRPKDTVSFGVKLD